MKIWHQIFELSRGINKTNVLTKFHDDRTINVASRVFTSKNVGDGRQTNGRSQKLTMSTLCSECSHETNILTKFHEDWTKNVTSRVFTQNCPSPWRPCFFTDLDFFELVQDINETNVMTKYNDYWAKIVTSRVFTRFLYSHIWNTAPSPGGNVFQRTGTIFELNQHII
ncbi:hypothetical protein DPMN_028937 [Dreissena polymorpha]|uniref:Uncharacterized protein n=1 Tax=Dreissena polymorpha TaxID=45954 RepID=A0A9D4LY71_DREPO|nr:hypothetical protein DPMN_028937 [Dreissena polymorpha]